MRGYFSDGQLKSSRDHFWVTKTNKNGLLNIQEQNLERPETTEDTGGEETDTCYDDFFLDISDQPARELGHIHIFEDENLDTDEEVDSCTENSDMVDDKLASEFWGLE